jgi:hypothetical protein
MKKYLLVGLYLLSFNLYASNIIHPFKEYEFKEVIVFENNNSIVNFDLFLQNKSHNLEKKTSLGIKCKKNTLIYVDMNNLSNNNTKQYSFPCGTIVTIDVRK